MEIQSIALIMITQFLIKEMDERRRWMMDGVVGMGGGGGGSSYGDGLIPIFLKICNLAS